MNPIEFLTFIDASLKSFRKAGAIYQAELAPSFSPIEVLNPNENALSRFFAELLSPVGGHGQGNLFLKLFVEHFKFSDDWIDLDSPITRTEHSTDQGRRIDISIKFEKGIIGIENKPWAGDQKDQVKDYIMYLKKNHPISHYLIYLSPNGEDASVYSKGGGQFDTLRLVSYADWNQWLVKCAEKARSKRVQFFIEEFVRYINKEFFGVQNMTETNNLLEQILESEDKIIATFEIYATQSILKKKLLNKLTDSVKQEINERNIALMVDSDISPTKGTGISFKVNDNDSYRFRIAFDKPNCNELLIGVCKTHNSAQRKQKLEELMQTMPGRVELPSYWAYWRYYADRDWEFKGDPWAKIQSGAMAKEMVTEIMALYKHLEKVEGGLDLLK